jgi:hypothetical protein
LAEKENFLKPGDDSNQINGIAYYQSAVFQSWQSLPGFHNSNKYRKPVTSKILENEINPCLTFSINLSAESKSKIESRK